MLQWLNCDKIKYRSDMIWSQKYCCVLAHCEKTLCFIIHISPMQKGFINSNVKEENSILFVEKTLYPSE